MPKYLDIPEFDDYNTFLSRNDFENQTIFGRLIAYSLKMVQNDKKLVKRLQREFSNENIVCNHVNQNVKLNACELDESIQQILQTSIGNLHQFSTVRLISYFISALNNTYPNYDFSGTPPKEFQSENGTNIIHLVLCAFQNNRIFD